MTFININLRGACDGLSLLAPVNDTVYKAARPTLALKATDVVMLDSRFGLTNAAPGLAALWASKNLAIVPAVGYPGMVRSHFVAESIMGSGGGTAGTGWLARYLNQTGTGTPNPLRGVHVDTVTMGDSLRGTNDALGCASLPTTRLGRLFTPWNGPLGLVSPANGGLKLNPPSSALVDKWAPSDGAAYAGANGAVGVLDRIAALQPKQVDPAPYGPGPDAGAYAAAVGVMEANLGTEVIQITIQGWDHHHNLGPVNGSFAKMVAALDRGITGIMNWSKANNHPVTIMVSSEFGRRVAENSSAGLDHGTGSVVLLIGDRVSPGIRGVWPGLGQLQNGDVPGVNSFRAIQHEIATRILNAPRPSDVVSGVTPSQWLGVIRA